MHVSPLFPDIRRLVRRAARYHWAATLWLIFVVASTLTRVAILSWADASAIAHPTAVARAFAAGAAYDALVALWLIAPFMVYLTLARSARFDRRAQRVWRRVAVGLAIAVAIFTGVSELIFFDEFNGRFNFVAVDYLVYPTEVTTNIWQSYHAGWGLAAIAVAVALALGGLRPALRRFDHQTGPASRWRLTVGAGYAAVVLVLTLTLSPALSHVSDDRVLNEIAGNGYYTFWRSVLGHDAPYEGLYATRPDSVVFPDLKRLLA